MDQVTVILPCSDATSDDNSQQQFAINALRQSSSYFDAMLGGRWSETHDNENGSQNNGGMAASRVVDLSQTGLDLFACDSVLRFMISRYCDNDSNNEESTYSNKDGQTFKRKKVTLEEMKELFWEGFQWDEEESTVDWGRQIRDWEAPHISQNTDHQQRMQPLSSETDSDEVKLHRAIDYLHLQPHDIILLKLWAIKIVHCPCFLEEALKDQGLIGERYNAGEGEMYIERIPDKGDVIQQQMWRFLVCMFMCRMLVYEEDGKEGGEVGTTVSQIRAKNYQRKVATSKILDQLWYLSPGIGEKPTILLREMILGGLLNKKDGSKFSDNPMCWQSSLDSQVIKLWEFMESPYSFS